MSKPRVDAYYAAFIGTIVTTFLGESDNMIQGLFLFLIGTTAMLFLIFLGNDRLKGFNK